MSKPNPKVIVLGVGPLERLIGAMRVEPSKVRLVPLLRGPHKFPCPLHV